MIICAKYIEYSSDKDMNEKLYLQVLAESNSNVMRCL